MKSDEIDYKIIGNDLQLVEVELDPGETVIAEAGAMSWMHPDISYNAKMGDGSETNEGFLGKVMKAGGRLLTGESLFMTHFTNEGDEKRQIAFGSPYPGQIMPMNLAKLGNVVHCQKDAFLCSAYGTKVSISFQKKIGTGFFGGEGFIMQKLEGNGKAFIQAGGTIVKKKLENETILVDTGCVVAYTDGINFDIESVKGLKTMLFGGEGMFLARLSGTGYILLQTLPFSRLADRITENSSKTGTSSQGEGSILGNIATGFLQD